MKLHTAIFFASTISGLSIFVCLFAIVNIYNDVQSIWTELDNEIGTFRSTTDDLWDDMMRLGNGKKRNRREAYEVKPSSENYENQPQGPSVQNGSPAPHKASPPSIPPSLASGSESGGCNCQIENNKCPSGVNGNPGLDGLDGINGVPGKDSEDITPETQDTGTCFNCPAGPIGAPGAVGRPGPRGLVGQAGQAGQAGRDGQPGHTGESGLPGPPVSFKSTVQSLIRFVCRGKVGPQGLQGQKGNDAQHLIGRPGLKGEKGDAGPIGPIGVEGKEGPAGPQGPQGPKGSQGEHGPSGALRSQIEIAAIAHLAISLSPKMRLTSILNGNLNKVHWDRRVWQIGYSGSPLPKKKATGRPHIPISDYRRELLRQRFNREHQVMRWLCTPYLNKEAEQPYVEKYGKFADELKKQQKEVELAKMPGDAKLLNEHGEALKPMANYGNLLHKPRTVEDSLRCLINKNRWD
ncbi:hypothetical protein M3Y98_00816100 [Aphelenchoides besseyi]|nr:hypothetical protein M3Y98_00816100 [Aphelenchoides besseyi]